MALVFVQLIDIPTLAASLLIVIGYKSDGSDRDANLTAVLERARATG